MKKIIIGISLIIVAFTACKKDSDYLDVPVIGVLPIDQSFSDNATITSILADLYDRTVDPIDINSNGDLNDFANFSDFGEAFTSDNNWYGIVQNTDWDYASWSIWDYGYIRDLNLFIERLDSSNAAAILQFKPQYRAEARFLRASYYFELVKRMGGVPLILNSLTYDPGQGVDELQFPRSKESDIYDFIISEAEDIKDDLPKDASIKDRATWAAALAMESRAALYAASIAKYGSEHAFGFYAGR